MSENKSKYSNLAPLTIQERISIALAALEFFSGMNQDKVLKIIGKTSPVGTTLPLSSTDFPDFLEKKGVLRDPIRYMYSIRVLLESLANAGLLLDMGGGGSNVMLSKKYFYLKEFTKIQAKGVFSLSRALGIDFLYELIRSNILHITGVTSLGDVHAGSGLVVADNVILTCAHVINDMAVDSKQTFFETPYQVIDMRPHPTIDVGLIYVDGPPLPHNTMGMPFVSPVIGKELVILGYPKIPYAAHAPLTMQRGEVTCDELMTLHGEKVFLFSASARPGNSGGPILSVDGEFLGLVTKDLTYQLGASDQPSGGAFSPHFAGVPTAEVAGAVRDLDPGLYLPIEDYQ